MLMVDVCNEQLNEYERVELEQYENDQMERNHSDNVSKELHHFE